MAQVNKIKKIVAVGDQLLSIGLKIGGIKETYVMKPGEGLESLLWKLFERDDIGILIISESLANSVKDKRIRHKMDTSIDPIIMEVPGYNEKETRIDTLRALILRTIGIDIANLAKGKK